MDNKHLFAIYWQAVEKYANEKTVCLGDQQLYQRIVKILRLTEDDKIILFNKKINIHFKIIDINKKEVFLELISIHKNKEFKNKISVFICLIKKDAFEQAIYNCVEMGATVIQPIVTQKSHYKKFVKNDLDRLNKILISAAEQSKNFNFPELNDPIDFACLKNEFQNKNTSKIYFDANGQKIDLVLKEVSKSNDFILMTGPEGDLTNNEKELLKENKFIFCALTPTILRSQTAISLAIGIFRSYFD